MKNIRNKIKLTIVIISMLSCSAMAQTRKIFVADLDNGESLKEILSDTNSGIDSLVIKGKMTAEDFYTVRKYAYMTNILKGLNLRDSRIENNSIPKNALSDPDINNLPGKIQYISLPETIEMIGENAFSGIDALDINLPKSLKNLGAGSFSGCFKSEGSVKVIIVPEGVKTIPAACFDGASQIKCFKFPNNLEEIGLQAFLYCDLDSVILPASLKKIGEGCFANAIKSKVICHAIIPPAFIKREGNPVSPFDECGNLVLYVPKGCVDAYKVAYPWSEFKQIKEIEDPSGVEDIATDRNKSEGAIFDLLGRKVTNPVPGRIYIRDGKKFVDPKD